MTVAPDRKKIYAGEPGIVLTLNNASTDASRLFVAGSVAVLNGIDAPTEFVDMRTLRVALDDIPEVRNTPGSVVVQVRNPGTDPSVAVVPLLLIGPLVKKVTVADGSNITLTVRGKYVLDDATVDVRLADGSGTAVPLMSVERTSKKSFRVRIERAAVPAGTQVEVRIANPGPAYSAAVVATIP